MQKQLLRFTFFLMYLTLPLMATAQVVDIPDPNLRAIIETELGKASGAAIIVDDMRELGHLSAANANISDLTGLEHAIRLDELYLSNNNVSDISALAGLFELDWLYLSNNNVSDISALAGLLGLDRLYLSNNNVSDISALAGLTDLEALSLSNNNISDISALAGLTNLERLYLSNNVISDLFPLVANPGLGVPIEVLGIEEEDFDDWNYVIRGLQRDDVIQVHGNPLSDISINTHIPTLRGRGIRGLYSSQLFLPLIAPVAVGQRFTLNLTVRNVYDLGGWQLNVTFNPAVLKAISVSEGDFLSRYGGNTFFQEGNINNAAGSITGISGAVIGTGGVSGSGPLLSITFEAKAAGQGLLQLSEDRLGASNGNQIHYDIVIHPVIVESTYDLNGDGKVDILDLMLVAQNIGKANPQADANHDGTVDVFDLIAVAQHLDSAPQAPSSLAYHGAALHSTTIQNWIDMAHAADDGSLTFRQGIANLKQLLAAMVPDKTGLLTNYPNPFNPETWIPYHLAHAADVKLTIYDTKGVVVRQLDMGHQRAGYYTDRSRAAYWDGQSETGEQVASGVYFYHLSAGDYSATRKMLILK